MYAVFYTDDALPDGRPPADMIPLYFATSEAALEASHGILGSGGIVWRIEGPGDGVTFMEREAIEQMYKRP